MFVTINGSLIFLWLTMFYSDSFKTRKIEPNHVNHRGSYRYLLLAFRGENNQDLVLLIMLRRLGLLTKTCTQIPPCSRCDSFHEHILVEESHAVMGGEGKGHTNTSTPIEAWSKWAKSSTRMGRCAITLSAPRLEQ